MQLYHLNGVGVFIMSYEYEKWSNPFNDLNSVLDFGFLMSIQVKLSFFNL